MHRGMVVKNFLEAAMVIVTTPVVTQCYWKGSLRDVSQMDCTMALNLTVGLYWVANHFLC